MRCFPGSASLSALIHSLTVSILLTTVAPGLVSGQDRYTAMTSFRYSGAPKPISSLDLIGEYDQLAPYARWWKETAACAGVPLLAIRPNSVRFFYVNVVDFAPEPTDKPGRMVVAVTYARSQQIFISILQAKTENIVKHEMLHQILYWWNESRWDDEALPEFVRCGLDVPWTPQRNSISLR